MCLYSHTKNFKKSKENITCYKVLLKVENFTVDEIYYLTPYQKNSVLSSQFQKIINDNKKLFATPINLNNKKLYAITSGGFHSFKNLQDAVTELKWNCFFNNYSDNGIWTIAKCIIPQNTYFIEGEFDDTPAYISKSIVYQEIIPYETN